MTLSRELRLVLLGAVSVAAIAAAPAAQAADAPKNDQTAAQAGVGEIIVTAQRKSESLQSVPVSVTAVSAAQLASRDVHDLAQISLAVPSLQTTVDNNYSLRGVGSQIFSPNVDSSVGVMVDDVSLGVPLFQSNGIFNDIAQVEVLTGPQGLLFGRNASAGLINIISQKPKLNELGGEALVEYDNRDATPGHSQGYVLNGTLNVPVSENSALRVNAAYSNQDPIAKAVVNTSTDAHLNQTRLSFKAKYLWKPTADLSVYLIGDYSHEDGIGGIWDRTYRSFSNPNSNDAVATAAEGVTAGPTNLKYGIDGANYRTVDSYGVSGNITYRLSPSLALYSITAWRGYKVSLNLDSDYTSTNLVNTNTNHQSYNQYSEELRLAISSGALEGQIGGYAFYSKNSQNGLLSAELGSGDFYLAGSDYAGSNSNRSLASFGQFQFHLTPALQLIAGGRMTNDRISSLYNTDELPWQLAALNGPKQTTGGTFSHTDFSYKGGAQYKIDQKVMAYATYSRGYKGPAYNQSVPVIGVSPLVAPETVTNIEAGLKSTLFDGKLRFNISAFIEKFKNFQTQVFLAGTGEALDGNAGGVKSAGVEIDGSARPAPALTFNYSATFQDPHFTNFATDACYQGQTSNGCKTSSYFEGSGIATPASAKTTITLEGLYEVSLSGANSIVFGANWYHRSSINFSAAGAPFAEEGAVDLFGLDAKLKVGKKLSLSVFCKNCTNKLTPTYISNDPGDGLFGSVSTYQQWGYNSVRTIGGTLGIKF